VRISSYYMLFVTSLISLYVLPSLSKDSSHRNYRSTIWNFYKTILPLVVVGLIAVYFSRNLIISILFTEEFEDSSRLFKWQLLGDFIKIVTTVMAFRFIAMNDLWRYLIAEVLSILSFYLFSLYLIPTYQEQGVVMAYLGNYLFYLALLLVILRKELFSKAALL
jgi:PST family polysaccharide transporter